MVNSNFPSGISDMPAPGSWEDRSARQVEKAFSQSTNELAVGLPDYIYLIAILAVRLKVEDVAETFGVSVEDAQKLMEDSTFASVIDDVAAELNEPSPNAAPDETAPAPDGEPAEDHSPEPTIGDIIDSVSSRSAAGKAAMDAFYTSVHVVGCEGGDRCECQFRDPRSGIFTIGGVVSIDPSGAGIEAAQKPMDESKFSSVIDEPSPNAAPEVATPTPTPAAAPVTADLGPAPVEFTAPTAGSWLDRAAREVMDLVATETGDPTIGFSAKAYRLSVTAIDTAVSNAEQTGKWSNSTAEQALRDTGFADIVAELAILLTPAPVEPAPPVAPARNVGVTFGGGVATIDPNTVDGKKVVDAIIAGAFSGGVAEPVAEVPTTLWLDAARWLQHASIALTSADAAEGRYLMGTVAQLLDDALGDLLDPQHDAAVITDTEESVRKLAGTLRDTADTVMSAKASTESLLPGPLAGKLRGIAGRLERILPAPKVTI